jgi:hypothetical protein
MHIDGPISLYSSDLYGWVDMCIFPPPSLFFLCRCSSICKLFPGDADFCCQVERELYASANFFRVMQIFAVKLNTNFAICRNLGDACRVEGM